MDLGSDLDNYFPNLFCGDQGTVGSERVVNARVGHQVGLELIQVDIESSVKPQRGRDGGEYLCDEPVEVGVGGTLNTEVVLAQVVDGLVVHEEGNIRVLQSCVGEQDGVVGLYYRGGDLPASQSVSQDGNKQSQLYLGSGVDGEC